MILEKLYEKIKQKIYTYVKNIGIEKFEYLEIAYSNLGYELPNDSKLYFDYNIHTEEIKLIINDYDPQDSYDDVEFIINEKKNKIIVNITERIWDKTTLHFDDVDALLEYLEEEYNL